MGFGQRLEIGDNRGGVDQFDIDARCPLRIHHPPGIPKLCPAVIVCCDGRHGKTSHICFQDFADINFL
jgi:hypothetical protein